MGNGKECWINWFVKYRKWGDYRPVKGGILTKGYAKSGILTGRIILILIKEITN